MSTQPNNQGGRRNRRRNRGSGKLLDEIPQVLTMNRCTQSAANTYAEVLTTVPNLGVQLGNRHFVMEILKIWIQCQIPTFVAATAVTMTAWVAKKAYGAAIAHMSEPTSLAFQQNIVAFPAVMANNASQYSANHAPFMIDYTDGKGNGILFAGKDLYLGLNTVGAAAALACSAKILYRFREVDASELIGLVQEG